MGINVELFVEEVDSNYLCSICQDVAERAVYPLDCEHVFCKDCIEEWTRTSEASTCPLCRSEIQPLVDFAYLDNMIGNLIVKCPNGCGHQTPYDEMVYHLPQCNPDTCSKGCGYASFDFTQHNCVVYLREQLVASKSMQRALERDINGEREFTAQMRGMFELYFERMEPELEQTRHEIQGLRSHNSRLRRGLRLSESLRSMPYTRHQN